MNRIIARIAVFALCLSLCCVVQASPAEQPRSYTVTETVVNPLYPEFQDEAVPAEVVPVAGDYRPNASGKEYVSLEKAVRQLEAALEKRQEVIYLYVDDPDFVSAITLFNLIGTHTGVPTQGDYIALSYRSYKSSVTANYIEVGFGCRYTYDVKLTMTYHHNASQERELTAKIKEVLADLKLSQIPDEYHRIKAIYTYITDHVTYVQTYDKDDPYYLLQYSAYGALVEGKAVCQGISTLLYRMLLEAGFDNRVIIGWVWTGSHAWNIVKIGELYYNTDATNDLGRDTLKYFCRSAEFFESHTRDSAYETSSFLTRFPTSADEYYHGDCITVAPTCEDNGHVEWNCSYCGERKSYILYALGHEWVYSGVRYPTCEEDGYYYHDCTRCGSRLQEYREPLGHDFNLVIVREPTDSEEGLLKEVCIKCGHTQESSIPSHQHAYGEPVCVEPTCDKRGYTVQICGFEGCKAELRYDYTAPAAHVWEAENRHNCHDCGCIFEGCSNCDMKRVMRFKDVPHPSFYSEAVFWATEQGITSGTGQSTFSPNAVCQRAQVVTFLWRAAGAPEPASTDNPFVDVKKTDYYYKAVLWAVENDITKGMDSSHFGPFASCNRAQVVTFLHRAMGNPMPVNIDHPFTDVDLSMFYYNAMLWAVESGITNGLTPTTFGPNDTCNRAQIVTFLYRAYC